MGVDRATDPLGGEWVTLLLLIALMTLAWINVLSPRKWRLLWSAAVRIRLGRQTLREEVQLQDRTLVALVLVSVLVTGLFGHQFAVSRGMMRPGFAGSMLVTAIVLAIVMAQTLVLRLIAILFHTDQGSGEYLRVSLLMQVVIGMVLLPITMLGAYQAGWRQALGVIGAAAIAVLVLARWVRALAIGRGHGNSLRSILLYLCAAEILPAAIALRSLQRLLPDVHTP